MGCVKVSNKKSFGLFYKKGSAGFKGVPLFSAHVNVWNISESDNPFIDLGLLIENYKCVESICFMVPFEVDVEDIEDLSYVLKEDEIQLIFNNSKYAYQQYQQMEAAFNTGFINDKQEKALIFPIKDEDGNVLQNVEYIKNSGKIQIKIDIKKFGIIPDSINSIYIRFRIKNVDAQKILSNLPVKNNYLESAFVKRQILDFKLNNVRTIKRHDLNQLSNENYSLIQFKAIHLFVMVPSDYEISVWGDFSECRQLEKNEWNNYLKNSVSKPKEEIFAYHWKQKAENEKTVDEFAQLIKMEHKSTNLIMIAIYCLIVIILGALGSGLAELITH